MVHMAETSMSRVAEVDMLGAEVDMLVAEDLAGLATIQTPAMEGLATIQTPGTEGLATIQTQGAIGLATIQTQEMEQAEGKFLLLLPHPGSTDPYGNTKRST